MKCGKKHIAKNCMPENFESKNERSESVLRTVEWEGGEAQIMYAGPEDRQGIIEADQDRKRYRAEKYNVTQTKESIEKKREAPLEERMADDKFIFLVVKVGDEVAGYIELRDAPDMGEKTVWVETLSILEKYFRNKFGNNLTEQGIEEAKKVFGAENIGLWTNRENEPAIQLYEKMGFTRTGKERIDEGKTWAGKPSVSIGLVKNLHIRTNDKHESR